MTQLTIAYVII